MTCGDLLLTQRTPVRVWEREDSSMLLRAVLHCLGVPPLGEVAQRLGALAALPEDKGSVPRTHMATHNQL